MTTQTTVKLQPGNQKLGKIHQFSLPPQTTCGGSTQLCRERCYACDGHYNRGSVIRSLEQAYEWASHPSFVPRVVDFLARTRQKGPVRIHAAGDFYSEGYIRKWMKIIERCPDRVFYAYTRSWRTQSGSRSRMVPDLLNLARLDNMYLWFSCDAESGAPPRSNAVRRAYMAISDEDSPRFSVDLVFRCERKTPMKTDPMTGALVCPVEQGIQRQSKITCDKCQLCFGNERQIWRK